jgi:hypothetical protein
MINRATNKPLTLTTVNPVWPYLILPFSQLEEVRRLLDRHKVRYWVSENAISMDGGPETIIIYLGRGEEDAVAIQAILDSVP